MSTYVREKVLRIPLDKTNLGEVLFSKDPEGWEDDGFWNAENVFPELFKYGQEGFFQCAPTEEPFIDFVLEYEWDCDGDWGKVRKLRQSEQDKWEKKFHEIDPTINMNDVRLVEFCWYNGTDAPDYYDEEKDNFYAEV